MDQMTHPKAMLLALCLALSLTACGPLASPSAPGDGSFPPEESTPAPTPEPTPAPDPYDAVRNFWSEDQLTQAWGPNQVVEHLFFHPVIAYPQWAFHDCSSTQSQKEGLDDWMVTVDEYNKILNISMKRVTSWWPSKMFGARSPTIQEPTWSAIHLCSRRVKSPW